MAGTLTTLLLQDITYIHTYMYTGVRRGGFTCVEWQVTLCDSIWQVTSRSSEIGFPWMAWRAIISTFLYRHKFITHTRVSGVCLRPGVH